MPDAGAEARAAIEAAGRLPDDELNLAAVALQFAGHPLGQIDQPAGAVGGPEPAAALRLVAAQHEQSEFAVERLGRIVALGLTLTRRTPEATYESGSKTHSGRSPRRLVKLPKVSRTGA